MLTDKQLEILRFCVLKAELTLPTVRDIAQHFGIVPATVQDHLNAIRRKGYLNDFSMRRKRPR